MKKNLINYLTDIVLIYIFISLFIYSKELKENILFTLELWVNNLIPSIFPFLLFANLFRNYGIIDILNNFFGPIIQKIYNLPKEASFPIIMSMFSGFPTGSKYVKDLLNNKEITENEANCLITFTNYSNPLFVISIIGETLLGNKRIGIIIYIIHIITGLIIGLLFKNRNLLKSKKTNINKSNKEKLMPILVKSIKEIFEILLNVLGIMLFFNIIITILNKILKETILTTIIKSIIEITSGINLISKLNINIRIKASIIGALLSFSGLSVHFQTKSIIEGSNIKYNRYLYARIFHSLLCFITIYTLFYLF